MCNWSLGFASLLFLLISTSTKADEQEVPLSADFLRYLAEFSDEQGELLDPEMLVEIMHQQQITTAQEPSDADTQTDVLAVEVKP